MWCFGNAAGSCFSRLSGLKILSGVVISKGVTIGSKTWNRQRRTCVLFTVFSSRCAYREVLSPNARGRTPFQTRFYHDLRRFWLIPQAVSLERYCRYLSIDLHICSNIKTGFAGDKLEFDQIPLPGLSQKSLRDHGRCYLAGTYSYIYI